MAVILSKRDKVKFGHEGYLYCFASSSSDGTKKFWRCEKRVSDECPARLHTSTDTGVVLAVLNNHTHGSDVADVQAAVIKTSIKRRAEETVEIPSVILNQSCQGVSRAVLGKIGNKHSARMIIQRKRKTLTAAPVLPITRETIIIPEAYRSYESTEGQREGFLLYDSGEEDVNRILIFGKQSHIQWSHQMKKLYVDGTFSLAPLLFAQVYVVMAERGGFVFPLLYALLPNKTEETYCKMFQAMRIFWPDLNPTSISTDFELAALNAIKLVFPQAELYGCLFHLAKNMKKKLANEGLTQLYNTDPDFALSARMIVALAFVPPASVEEALDILSVETPPALQPVMNWFEDAYMGRMMRRGRRVATFPNAIWTVYQRTLDGTDRTNNHAEAAHRRLQAEFGMDHPSLWKFIDGIRAVQCGRDKCYEEFVRGDAPAVKRTKYVRADARILTIVQDFGNRTISEYLRGISHNFLMD